MHTANNASRASTGLLQDKPLKHRARLVARASTGLLPDKPLKHRARLVARASTGMVQDKPLKHHARCAVWASTWSQQEERMKHRARIVPVASTELLQDKRQHHLALIAVWASMLHQERVSARIASTDNTKTGQGRVNANRAGSGNLQVMSMNRNPLAYLATLATTNQMKARAHAPHANLASIKRLQRRISAPAVRWGFILESPLQRLQPCVCIACRGPTLSKQQAPAPHAGRASTIPSSAQAAARCVKASRRTLQTSA